MKIYKKINLGLSLGRPQGLFLSFPLMERQLGILLHPGLVVAEETGPRMDSEHEIDEAELCIAFSLGGELADLLVRRVRLSGDLNFVFVYQYIK